MQTMIRFFMLEQFDKKKKKKELDDEFFLYKNLHFWIYCFELNKVHNTIL